MSMELKWKMNDVVATRGNMRSCIVKFNNSRVWLAGSAIMSVQTFKANVRAIAKCFGAKAAEVKYLHMDDDAGTLTEPHENIVLFSDRGGDDYRFFTESIDPVTNRRSIHYLAPEEVFHLGDAQTISAA